MQNYFELFSLKVDFAIDLSALEHTYQMQIAQYHPDKFATADDKKNIENCEKNVLFFLHFSVFFHEKRMSVPLFKDP
jgi:hypothetical protein